MRVACLNKFGKQGKIHSAILRFNAFLSMLSCLSLNLMVIPVPKSLSL